MKFCKDCANYAPMQFNKDDGNCSADEHGINLVTGVKTIKVCSAQRSVDADVVKGYCGKQAIYFKVKS